MEFVLSIIYDKIEKKNIVCTSIKNLTCQYFFDGIIDGHSIKKLNEIKLDNPLFHPPPRLLLLLLPIQKTSSPLHLFSYN